LRALSPAGVSPPYPAVLGSNTFTTEKSWEVYGKDTAMDVAGMSEGKQPTRTQNLREELASWFGNLVKHAEDVSFYNLLAIHGPAPGKP
jgi:hypothetical protein